MSLVTRCPRCSTLYRVTPVQLQARAGKVRCGRCMNVFDGFQALAVEQADAVSEPVRFEPGRAEAAAAASAAVAEGAHPRVDASAAAAPAGAPKGTVREAPKPASTAPAREPASVPPPAGPVAPAAPAKTQLLRRPGAVAAWSAACAVAALLLALQIVYVWRSELAARSPAVRSVFSSFCDTVGCSVPLPHRPDLVKIEASDVQMVDAARPQLVQLTATLRSYAGYYLAYPALDLVLTNANEHALARRIFVPQEYLDPNRDPKAGFPPRAEITIALDLDTSDLNAAGFRLDLLAAP
ncbi:MAG: zinc-ribbon and DUF3426 domain-containing protein [Burkholderiales bacterium]